MARLVFIGPPGSGKGTQAEKLVSERGLRHISTGDLLRHAIKTGTALGLQAKAAVDAGELVPDDVVIGLVEESLSDGTAAAGFILDGFPRTVAQAEALETLLNRKELPLDHVILFDIPVDRLEQRIAKRAEQSRSTASPIRSDDNPDVLKRRVEEFLTATAALSPFYEKRRLLRRIDATNGIDDVTRTVLHLITT
ncbi:adenylate kinase [Neorhizobium vignae]|uniref:adenylate kinase n=1 Tax=Neorhizobium vignae TaxID=690585 RepID=UPI0005632107|nr:adenylate kinase [Neorhizobium vignae]